MQEQNVLRLFIFIFLISFSSSSLCQSNSSIKVVIKNNCVTESTVQIDSTDLKSFIENIKSSNILSGNLSFSVDSILSFKDSILLYTFKGKNYQFSDINFLGDFQDQSESINGYEQLQSLVNEKMVHLENHGYPFSYTSLTSHLDSNTVSLEISLDTGPYIVFDSLFISPENIINSSFLYNYLNFKPGLAYNEKLLSNIQKKINNSGILKLNSPPSVIFRKNLAQVYLNITKVNSSKFDGILGFQPADDGTTSITGLVNVSLKNSLKRGEHLAFHWERLKTQNQRLSTAISFPYLFKTHAGIEFTALIIRQDSTLNRAKLNYDLFYDLSNRSRISFGVSSIKNNSNINENSSFQNTQSSVYSSSFSYKKLDYFLNPRKGLIFKLKFSHGNRTDSESEKSKLTSLSGQSEIYVPIRKKSTVRIFTLGESTTGNDLFDNELFQIGGLNSIRGVDQRSILVSSWMTSGVEYRFLFEENSNAFIFYEKNFSEKNTIEHYENQLIDALGLGFSIGTKNGIFSFNYGVSNEFRNTFLIKNAKINFGYTSTF